MQPLPIRAVHHISLQTKRLAESRKFYCEVMGFREIERPNFNFSGAWLFNYGVQIHLIEHPSAPDPQGEIITRANHVAFHVDDMEVARQRLVEAGIEFRENLIAERNLHQLFFRDPDGHHLELATYPDTPPFVQNG